MVKLSDQVKYVSPEQLWTAYPNVFTRVAIETLEQAVTFASNDIDEITGTTHDAYPDTDGYINRLCMILAAIEICRALLADAEDEKLEDYTFDEIKKFKALCDALTKERDNQLRRGGYDVPDEDSMPDNINATARGRGWKRRTDQSSTVQYVPPGRFNNGGSRW